MLGSRVARESIHVMCVRGDRRSAEIDSFTYNFSMKNLSKQVTYSKSEISYLLSAFSLFTDPLFPLQSPSSARGKK